MKRIISILTAVLYGFTGLAQDKVALGLDLTPDISDGYICICGGHGFSKRWSAAFSVETSMIQAVKERDQEYDDHLSEFGGSLEKYQQRKLVLQAMSETFIANNSCRDIIEKVRDDAIYYALDEDVDFRGTVGEKSLTIK